jgi:hypothetical protein
MSTRDLIYLLCFGDDSYRRMTELCIESLRVWGRFEGDILVFTDGSYRRPPPGVDVIEVPPLDDQFAIKSFKPFASRMIPSERYAHVAVMDADMVAVDDVSGLLPAPDRAIVGMVEYPFNSMLADSCGGALLHLEERPRASRTWGINTGFLSMSGSHVHENMRVWREEIERDAPRGNHWADQPYLNVLVFRGRLAFRRLPRHAIDMPPMYRWFNGDFRLRASTRLLHLCVGRNEVTVSLMSEIVRALRAGCGRGRVEQLLLSSVAARR